VIRIPETELMINENQALSYANADFTESNNIFINTTFKYVEINPNSQLLDVGCGDGEIPLTIFKKSQCHMTAIDGSQAMLDQFMIKMKKNNIKNISLHKNLIDHTLFPGKTFNIILCNSVLHHISDITLFWKTLFRLTKKKGVICLMDLIRPNSDKELMALLSKYGGNDHVLLEDFKNSLKAAYTINEVTEQLNYYKNISFNIKPVSDRHFFVNIETSDDNIY
jgi:ubiquinone/menaquinone biosynthesis C-methylase UbiE